MSSLREQQLREKPIEALFWQFSIPAITGMMVQALYNIVDRIFIGHMPHNSALAMGGLGIAMPLLFILMGFSMLFGIGSGANISIRLGERDHPRAQNIFSHGLVMLGISTVLLVSFGLWQLDGILRLFGATERNLPFARDYMKIILIGNLWNTFAFAFTHMIRSEGSPKVAMTSMIIGALTNTALDPLFIFGLDMGVKGAAYATVIAQFLSFLWSLRYYLGDNSLMKLRLPKRFSPAVVMTIMAIGVSPFFIQIAGSVVGALMNNQLKAYGGELAQSAYIAFAAITQLFFMPIFGMNQGLQPIVGFNYGARNFARVKQANLVGIKYATILCVIGWAGALLIPDFLVRLVTNDPAVIELSAKGLRIFESAMFLVGIQFISNNFFHSIGKAKISFILSVLRQFAIVAPLIIFLPRWFGLEGIWLSTPIADVLATAITVYFLLREYRILDKMAAETAVS